MEMNCANEYLMTLFTSRTLFFVSVLTVPAKQQWLIAFMMMWRFDLELGFTNNLGPEKIADVRTSKGTMSKLYDAR